jgi:hypothetical protein
MKYRMEKNPLTGEAEHELASEIRQLAGPPAGDSRVPVPPMHTGRTSS